MRTTTEKLLAACKDVLECAEAEQRTQIDAVDALRELVRDLGPTLRAMPSLQRAAALLDKIDGTEGYAIFRDGALVRAADAEPKYVVYMLGRSGDKKYDPTEFSYISSFFKQDARRMTEDEARKRVHELSSTYVGCNLFRYERAD